MQKVRTFSQNHAFVRQQQYAGKFVEPMNEMSRNVQPPEPTHARTLAFGAGVLAVASLIKMGLQLVSLPLMARLLGPTEFGLYAIAVPVVGFVSMLADGGLGVSLVREPETSPIWSTAFWALLGAGLSLSGLVILWGFALSVLTHQPRVTGLLAALSVSLVFMTTSVPPMARLDRRGRLAVGATADLIGNIVGSLLGIYAAFHHAGAWSLVFQYVSIYALRSLIVHCAAFKAPTFEWQPRLLLSHLSAGGQVMGTRVADFAGRMLENLALGQTLGIGGLGLYSFSSQVSRFLSEAISNPLWMTLYIRALRQDDAQTQVLQLQLSRLLCGILFPAAVVLSASAREIIIPLLGDKWLSAVPLLKILFPCFVLAALGSQTGAVLLAKNRYGIQLIGTIGLSILKIAAICLSPWIGLVGAVIGVAAANYIYATFMLLISAPITGLSPLKLLAALYGPLVASIMAWVAIHAILSHYNATYPLLAFALLAGGLAYFATLLLADRRQLLEDISSVRTMISKK